MSCIWNVKEEDRLCKCCKLTHCVERKNPGGRRHGKVMPTMRAMDLNDELVFDPSYYNACRTAAWRLKLDYGYRMLVGVRSDGVHVCRIK